MYIWSILYDKDTLIPLYNQSSYKLYPMEYAHDYVVLCFAVLMLSVSADSWDTFTHMLQGYFTGTGAIARLP